MGADSTEREQGQSPQTAGHHSTIKWLPRQLPLRPIALIANEPRSLIIALIDALLKLPAPELSRLRAWQLEPTGALVILGEERLLPTPSEAIYLGVDPQYPGLLMPCFLTPPQALLAATSRLYDPMAWTLLLPDPEHTLRQIKLSPGACPLSAQTLEAARHVHQ